ncbi:MAG: thiamine pyrophosphate-binding protein [Gammaproteobacteria bacterium]|nr:thiamine pyrophosphate-binding protein [Gammaproteobacteria bacterium]
MIQQSSTRTGAQVLIDALDINRVDLIFSIPGESFLAALDALYDKPSIELITCRQEGGAAYMAEAYGKLTGKPGICFVTRGPGATNASCGLHVAMQDSTPMILLIGQIARKDQDREAFQELDYRRMFSQVAKWVAQIEDASRIPEYLNRAFATATSGRPGPVVLALPEDMLLDNTAVTDARPWQTVATHPAATDVEKSVAMLAAAKRPLIIIGGSGWSESTRLDLQEFVEKASLPVINAFRCQDYIDHNHSSYIGDLGIGVNPTLTETIRAADCLLVIGARLGDMTTGGFELIDIPTPSQTMIHVHAGADELGHIYQPELAINASATTFIPQLKIYQLSAENLGTRQKLLRAARQSFENWSKPVQVEGPLQLAEIIQTIQHNTASDSIICNGAGNSTGWLHRFYRLHEYRTQLAPTSGTMGYGLPAAVAAKILFPQRTVVAFAGDGEFMTNGQELATAMQYDANVIVVVINNGTYGTIRLHQEREFPGRVIGTDIVNPDFCTLATAYGMQSELVTKTADFAAAFERAKAATRSALIEVKIDANLLTPTLTVSALRAAGSAEL